MWCRLPVSFSQSVVPRDSDTDRVGVREVSFYSFEKMVSFSYSYTNGSPCSFKIWCGILLK